MKTSIHLFIISFLCMICFDNAFAQKNNPTKDWMENNKNFHLQAKPVNALEKDNVEPDAITAKDIVYTLPVVVHIITSGDAIGSPDNPTDASINAMIKLLNNAYNKKGTNYGGVNMKIKFQLAVRSPLCIATTGINRVDGSSIPNYISGGITNINYAGSADEVAVKNLSRWSNT
ncbi:MAG: hypothetical protein ABI405_13400, partial [Parafilimonas sp.]